MDTCYNCGSQSHSSRNCRTPQRFSRCSICTNVCTSRSSHKGYCTNKDFISALIVSQETVLEGKMIEFGFRGITKASVFDGTTEKQISEVPLFVATVRKQIWKPVGMFNDWQRSGHQLCTWCKLVHERWIVVIIVSGQWSLSVPWKRIAWIQFRKYGFMFREWPDNKHWTPQKFRYHRL